MPERTEYAPGTPSWVDLSTTDVEAAKVFYAKVLGWTYRDMGPEAGNYVMASRDGKSAAGIMPHPEELAASGAPSMWNAYVTVADAAATVAATERAGGTVLQAPFDVMTAGKMAVVQDPAGAVISLWEPTGTAGAEVVNEHGALTWTDLVVPDPGAVAGFYATVFGWDPIASQRPDGTPAHMFVLDGAPVASAGPPPMEGVPPHWHVYFAVDDADAAASAITGAGGQVLSGPVDTPPGRMLGAMDPTGGAFSVIALNPDFDPAAG